MINKTKIILGIAGTITLAISIAIFIFLLNQKEDSKNNEDNKKVVVYEDKLKALLEKFMI